MSFRLRAAVCPLLVFFCASSAAGQDSSGSDLARVSGGLLGAYSGVVFGTAGSLIPCTQTRAGVKCVRVAAVSGGLVGLAAGVYMGSGSEDHVWRTYRGAAFGAAAGAAAGFVLWQVIPQYGPADMVTTAAIGGAIGTAPGGAALGFAGGMAVGAVLLWTVPSFELADVVGTGLVGMAVGGLAGWIIRSADANDNSEMELVLPFTVKF